MEKEQIILLEELFNRYFSHLVLYSGKLVGSQEPAEDIVQDVFLHLFETKRLKYATSSFLFTCVKNASLNYIHLSKKRTVPLSPAQEAIPEKDIHEEIAHMQQLERLDAAIESLPCQMQRDFQTGIFAGATLRRCRHAIRHLVPHRESAYDNRFPASTKTSFSITFPSPKC